MRPIPLKLKKELLADEWYSKCCICKRQPVSWHHHLIFAGRQVNKKFCIFPLCYEHHQSPNGVHNNPIIKMMISNLMNKRITENEKYKYGWRYFQKKKKNQKITEPIYIFTTNDIKLPK